MQASVLHTAPAARPDVASMLLDRLNPGAGRLRAASVEGHDGALARLHAQDKVLAKMRALNMENARLRHTVAALTDVVREAAVALAEQAGD